MKRIRLFILTVIVFTAISSYAQSTYSEPYRGATQTYTATVSDGSGLTTRWYVATDKSGTRATEGSDYTITAASGSYDPTSGVEAWVGTGIYSADITWGASLVVGTKYYVFLEVDATNGCTNRMACEVTIATAFNALVYNVTGAADPFAANQGDSDIKASGCPDDIVDPVWNGSSYTNIGTTTVVFKVLRQYSTAAWSFEYSVNDNGSSLSGITTVRIVNESNVQQYSGTSSTGVISIAADQDFALIYVTITNQQGATINVDLDLVTSSSNTKDADGTLDNNATDNNASYTIKPIPVISGFSGN